MECPECGEELWPWEAAGRDDEVYTCQNTHCEIVKILVVRKEDLK